jgi:hypothetical protein
MVRGPYDTEESQSPGGAAAERLREFLEQRFPGGAPPGSPLPPVTPEANGEAERCADQDENRDVAGSEQESSS